MTMIFTNFDRHALWDIMDGNSISSTDKKRYQYWRKITDVPAGGKSLLLGGRDIIDNLSSLGLELAKPNYSDQVPPR